MRVGRIICALLASALVVPATASVASTSGGGTQRWGASYGQDGSAYSSDIAVAPDGSAVFVTGTAHFNPWGQLATLAFDASTGEELWSTKFGRSADRGAGNAIAVSPDGATVFVGGAVCPDCPGGSDVSIVVAYDAATGQQLWVRRSALFSAKDLVATPDGTMILVDGNAQDETGNITALSASSGDEVWSVDVTDGLTARNALALSADGSTVYRAASADLFPTNCGHGGVGLVIRAIDTEDGSVRWASNAVGPDQVCSTPRGFALSPDGSRLVATGQLREVGGGGPYAAGMFVYDAESGELLSQTTLDELTMSSGSVNIPVTFDQDSTTAFVVGAHYVNDSSFTLVTTAVKLEDGSRSWTSQFDSGGMTYATAAATSSDGATVYALGEGWVACWPNCPSPSPTQSQVVLVAYDRATGAERWVRTRLDDTVSSVAVGPGSGGVYLAGSFTTAFSQSGENRRSARRGTACSAACGMSISATNVAAGVARIEDVDAGTSLNGWRTTFERSAIGGSYRASRTAGDAVTFDTPADTVVRWVTRRGPDMGRARVVIDGKVRGTVDLYAAEPSRASYLFDGLADRRHRITIRVLGQKAVASSGAWVAVDALRMKWRRVVVDETSTALRYGTWTGVRRVEASGGSLRRTHRAGQALSLTFKGRSVRWVTATGPGLGKARVIVDGVGRTVDLYSARVRWQTSIAFTGLGAGEHRIVVRPLGTKSRASRGTSVISDAFVVRP